MWPQGFLNISICLFQVVQNCRVGNHFCIWPHHRMYYCGTLCFWCVCGCETTFSLKIKTFTDCTDIMYPMLVVLRLPKPTHRIYWQDGTSRVPREKILAALVVFTFRFISLISQFTKLAVVPQPYTWRAVIHTSLPKCLMVGMHSVYALCFLIHNLFTSIHYLFTHIFHNWHWHMQTYI